MDNKSGTQAIKRQSANALTLINELISRFNCSRYLEIGVDRGATFLNVKTEYRTGVDNNFKFDYSKIVNNKTRCFDMTSDQFFTQAEPQSNYDLIYLDGMHTFEQTYRDFMNSLCFSHDKTIWVIDDTVPNDVISTHRRPKIAYQLKEKYGIGNHEWHGDVYKVVFALQSFLPRLSFCTITDVGNCRTLVWKQVRKDFTPIINSLEKISRMDYLAFLEHQDHLNFMTLEVAISQIENAFSN